MELFKTETKIDFLSERPRNLWFVISVLLVLIALAGLFWRGLNFGIDFTGGALIEVDYPSSIELNQVREDLAKAGYADASVQYFGTSNTVLIRLKASTQTTDTQRLTASILQALQTRAPQVKLHRAELVGPQVGQDLANQGGVATLLAVIGILIYIAFRFEFRFGFGAVVALLHDVLITVGILAWFQVTFDLSALAAVLTVLGYSVNDTIVIFDRIRENFASMRRATPMEVMNASINQTLSRTIITHGVTLLSVLALLFLGGEVIRPFSIAMTVGIVFGTYSSIYIASALALIMGVSRENLITATKDDKPKAQV